MVYAPNKSGTGTRVPITNFKKGETFVNDPYREQFKATGGMMKRSNSTQPSYRKTSEGSMTSRRKRYDEDYKKSKSSKKKSMFEF